LRFPITKPSVNINKTTNLNSRVNFELKIQSKANTVYPSSLSLETFMCFIVSK